MFFKTLTVLLLVLFPFFSKIILYSCEVSLQQIQQFLTLNLRKLCSAYFMGFKAVLNACHKVCLTILTLTSLINAEKQSGLNENIMKFQKYLI